ncbi:hypothetical protein GGR26_003608 [Lewinella marina]|uniref:HIRAN domain-containing protein n=1 Tax=Neolewinella marina TaxID=438751 RepID=A0A2G0CBH8_9BACT|nr:HIRAN domain-containing protein [Neolewinella marina]NJB87822.1 hypothetical protein [Neolewinella marina]PHK97287.1 hypothetical protein CGL56_17060 [Neolewinella marina]
MSILVVIIIVVFVAGLCQEVGSSARSRPKSKPETNQKNQSHPWNGSVRRRNKRNYKNVGVYKSAKISYDVKGIWAEEARIRAFNKLDQNDVLILEFEPDNAYDENALAVKTKEGVKLGYIEKNQRKLIKTLDQNPCNFATIKYVNGYYCQKYKRPVYKLEILVYVGFSKEELANEKNKLREIRIISIDKEKIKMQLKEFNANYKHFKETKAYLDFNNLEKLCDEIVLYNERIKQLGVNAKTFVPPIDKITMLTNHYGEYYKTLDFLEKFGDKYPYSDNQRTKFHKRIDQAESKINEY